MANLKITELTAVTAPQDGDLLPTVQNVSTTPVTMKVTWTVVKAFLKTYFDTLYTNPYTAGSTTALVAGSLGTVTGSGNGTSSGQTQTGFAGSRPHTTTAAATNTLTIFNSNVTSSSIIVLTAQGAVNTVSSGPYVYQITTAPSAGQFGVTIGTRSGSNMTAGFAVNITYIVVN